MNDFTDIESELKKLRPKEPSAQLVDKVEQVLADLVIEEKIIRPKGFQFSVVSLGLGLAAAAAVLIFIHFDFQTTAQRQSGIASTTPVPQTKVPVAAAGFLPAAATQVVYHMRDEGLVFPSGSDEPVRRMRSFTHETLQWRNASTGASLRVSYPTEQVELIPVSGQ